MRWLKNTKNSYKLNNLFNHNFFIKKKSHINIKTKKLINSKRNQFKLVFNRNVNTLINLNNLNIFINLKKYNNNNYIGVLKSLRGEISLISLINGVFIGDYFKNFILPIKLLQTIYTGSQIYLFCLSINCIISNIFSNSFQKYKYARAGGSFCQILEIKKSINLILIKLPSGIKKFFNKNSLCLLGRNSNINKKYIILGKASTLRFQGKKCSVRGVAKNPIDHPHGGRTKTNKPEVSPWGWITKHSH